MKVYIVTSGEYSDYHIVEVFTNKKQAQIFANLETGRIVEEYETDKVKIDFADRSEKIISVSYDMVHDEINFIDQDGRYDEPRVDEWRHRDFDFNVAASGKLYEDICLHGKDSKLLKRICQDRFSQWLYEKNMGYQEFMDKYHSPDKPIKPWMSIIEQYTTSSNCSDD